jgi:hypothetical protein
VPPRRIALIAAAVVAFLAISIELARFLTAEGAERDAIFKVLQAQARGDERGMLAEMPQCAREPACRRLAAANARRLHRPGRPKILSLQSGTSYTLGTATGTSRVAWAIVDRNGFPVVQCAKVRREWSFTSGASVRLLRLSAPIGNESDC